MLYATSVHIYYMTTGELIGFSDIGDVNQHLIQLEKQSLDPNYTEKLSTSMLALMIRGLFTDLTFPYASFPTSNLTGDQIVPIFYEALLRLERCGFKVACCTLDGNSVNRKFFQIVGCDSSYNIKYYTKNPCSFENRKVYFISDPPHLIKTTRNCLAITTRHMEVSYFARNKML